MRPNHNHRHNESVEDHVRNRCLDNLFHGHVGWGDSLHNEKQHSEGWRQLAELDVDQHEDAEPDGIEAQGWLTDLTLIPGFAKKS